ncbi:tetratricopeptide repeat protein [Lysobacter maris]|uniref:Tetratricopeptide repeat protein n=1 Tax=Marilutibacter maris TaxID=1605891 RepID=A0A508B2J0_9GAMM|nr:tetratricopeptide repeat protein [Lysobacter maris]KAB8198399.1 tetratricopeptide repeat protein [Lysobacter maris]
MDHLDDLPKRHGSHVTEEKAEADFHNLLSDSEDFVLQATDRKDYGTDCQIEVVDRESATNVRIYIQLKGTDRAANADGSISVEVRRSNLNYLLMQPHSLFVCYHVSSDKLLFCSADAVVRKYEHDGQNWSQQQTVTVTFTEPLTGERLRSLAALARSSAAASRNLRFMQATARPSDLPHIVKTALPYLHVPEDQAQAAEMLSDLYENGADRIISANFEKFASALGPEHAAMTFCYMAEINLSMCGQVGDADRVAEGITHLTSKIVAGLYMPGSLYYSIGNGLTALGRDEEAIHAYETALSHLIGEGGSQPLAECYKNLGSSHEKLGNQEEAVECFREALRYNAQLPEAHLALGLHCLKVGEYRKALEHFDQVIFSGRAYSKRASVSGWRINALFNLGDGKSAFREVGMLLGDAEDEAWIWPWCARQVASFGRISPESARLSLLFWDRYLKAHPDCPSGLRERLANKLYLRSEGQGLDLTYQLFKAEFDAGIQHVHGDAAAYLWDRLGHWAQDDKNWDEAERCFRSAYNLAGGHYGYCLGTALNFLGRADESLPILRTQAEEIQQDDMSWFQVAIAYEKLGRVSESIDAYMKAIALNPDYALAWFNMGGVHWNAGDLLEASRVWKEAVDRFPDHELADRIRRDIPFALS